eukprot:TRINITY_DN18638_c0_g2_i1.p1 TRINITY_DN18638_c0_g2~~TRINITY_DN18638_c0_g2_i1.p1  ORF type:complete len:246 (+),score=83.07 TRINITY_DN18638_c0_g2_i1:273-1010(+)
MLGLSEPSSRSRTRTPMMKKDAGGGDRAEQATKKEAASSEDDMKALVSLIGRVSLGASSKADSALGMLLDVMILPDDIVNTKGERLNVVVQDKMREYNEMTKAADRARMGPPHVRAWEALVSWAQLLKDEGGNEALKKALVDHAQEVKAMAPDVRVFSLGRAIKFCRVTKAYRQGTMRLECRIEEATECKTAERVWIEMYGVLTKMKGAEAKQGRAPQGALQRKCVETMKTMGMLKEEDDRMRDD